MICETCNHALCIGTSAITLKQVYECHKEEGKPRYIGYKEVACKDHAQKKPKIHKLFS